MPSESLSDNETAVNAPATQAPVSQPPAVLPSSQNHVAPFETEELPPPSSPLSGPHTPGPSSASTSTKRKFSALASQSGRTVSVLSAKKHQSVPGSVALNGIKESLDTFNRTIEHGLVVQPQELQIVRDTSPERRQKAIACLQEIETHLDDACLIVLINFFKVDTAEADTYIRLQRAREGIRRKWLQKQLVERCGFPADNADMF
jgi:hypothetical protein